MKDFLKQHDLVYDTAPLEWIQGIPMANGDMGVMLWGNGAPLKFSLDQYNVWEMRGKVRTDFEKYNYRNLQKLIVNRNQDEILRIFNQKSEIGKPCRTKLPLPCFNIDFKQTPKTFYARLNLHDAVTEGKIKFSKGTISYRSLVCSDDNTFIFEYNGRGEINTPKLEIDDNIFLNFGPEVKKLGYPNVKTLMKNWDYPAPIKTTEDNITSYYQQIPENGGYAISFGKISEEKGHEKIVLSIIWNQENQKAISLSKRKVRKCLKYHSSQFLNNHFSFWHAFWQKSFITIPDSNIENLYYAELYKLACCSKGQTPSPLQGLWTIGNGDIPPWKGDYHLNQNIQLTYWPTYTSNHLELGKPLYDMFSLLLPTFKKFCQDFFGFEGAHVPGACDPNGNLVKCWFTVIFWPGNGAWLAHMYWLYWKYSQDRNFLKNEAYPFMREILKTYLNLVKKDEDGKYHLPISSSPEWNCNDIDAWQKDTSGDIALMKWLAASLLETVRILEINDENSDRWRDLLDNLVDIPHDETGINLWAEQPQPESYLHFGHLLGIYPLDLITIEGSDKEKEMISKTMTHLRRLGFSSSTGFTMGWLSQLASRTGFPNMAWKMLKDYFCFISPNTMHRNGDPRYFGISRNDYTPVTLESGFCFANAVLQMLLQSWGGTIRVFPAIPEFWHDIYIENLRAEGAFLVSAKLKKGKVIFVKIKCEIGGLCRIKNPFNKKLTLINEKTGNAITSPKEIVSFTTKKGERFLLKPAGTKLSKKDLDDYCPVRNKKESNWFGLKKLPKF